MVFHYGIALGALLASVAANPGVLASLDSAATSAAADCAVEVATTGGAGAVACTAEFSVRASAALIAWAGAIAYMWATETTTPVPCGSSFNLTDGQTCYNFPAGSKCYQDCCSQQHAWCSNVHSGDDQEITHCMQDRACITPNVQVFSIEQIAFLRNDMDNLNDDYNELVATLQTIDLQTIIQTRRWSDLVLACDNMLLKTTDFIHAVQRAQSQVYCNDPGTLCNTIDAAHGFDLPTGTCFNFLGPCYKTCCQVQVAWCQKDLQCKHDRGCRATPEQEEDTLQADICGHLENCGRDMHDAAGYITNMHDCAQLASAGDPCSREIVANQYNQIRRHLNDTHSELQALESTIVGHGTHKLAPIVMTELPDISSYSAIASRHPFEVDRYDSSHQISRSSRTAAAQTSSGYLLFLSTAWTLLFFSGIVGSFFIMPRSTAPDQRQAQKDPPEHSTTGHTAAPRVTQPKEGPTTAPPVTQPKEGQGSPTSRNDNGSRLTARLLPDVEGAVTPTEISLLPLERQEESSLLKIWILLAVVWLLGQVLLALGYYPVVGGLGAPSPTPSPYAGIASGEYTLLDQSNAYWDDISTDMNTISVGLTHLQESDSCENMLLAPVVQGVNDLFQTLTAPPLKV